MKVDKNLPLFELQLKEILQRFHFSPLVYQIKLIQALIGVLPLGDTVHTSLEGGGDPADNCISTCDEH